MTTGDPVDGGSDLLRAQPNAGRGRTVLRAMMHLTKNRGMWWQRRRWRLDVHHSVYKYVYMAETVRIEPAAHLALVEIAREKHVSLTEALSRAVELYRRQVFLEGVAADFASLKADAGAWAEEEAERRVWDASNADGFEHE